MKTMVSLALLAGLTATVWGAGEVPASVNAAGYVVLPVPGTNAAPLGTGKLTTLAVPFVPVGTGAQSGRFTLDQVFGTRLHAGSAPAQADQVRLWSAAQTNFITAFLNNGGSDTNLLNKWCYLAGTNVALCATNSAFDLTPGRGCWIWNQGVSVTLLLQGEVPGVSASTNTIAGGLQMVAYPYPVSANIQTLITTNDGAYAHISPDAADQMIFWTGTNYFTVFLNGAGGPDPSLYYKWCSLQGQRRVLATNDIEPGTGFWYRRRGPGGWSWIKAKPYVWP